MANDHDSTNRQSQSQGSAEPELPVDKQWLVTQIELKCGVSCAILRKYKCSIIGEGTGFASICTRVQLEWDGSTLDASQLPKGVVIKKPTLERIAKLNIAEYNEVMNEDTLSRLHNREVRAYSFFAKHEPAPIPMARVFYAEPKVDPHTGMLIMEDLTDVGVSVSFISSEEISKERLLVLAEHVASLQAYGLNHPDCSDYVTPLDVHHMKALYSDTDKLVQKAMDTFPDSPYSKEDLHAVYTEACKDFDILGDPQESGFSSLITFGDPQPNNILWRVDANGKATNEVAAFLDFQMVMMGYGIADLVPAMILGMDTANRRACEGEVFQRYLAVLQEKSDLAVPITMGEVKRMYRKYLAIMAIVGFPRMLQIRKAIGVSPGEGSLLSDRFQAALEDAKIVDYES